MTTVTMGFPEKCITTSVSIPVVFFCKTKTNNQQRGRTPTATISFKSHTRNLNVDIKINTSLPRTYYKYINPSNARQAHNNKSVTTADASTCYDSTSRREI